MEPLAAHAAYAAAWGSFGLGHSLLARDSGRAWLHRRFGAGARLAYNGIAVLHVAAVVAVGWWALGGGGALGLPGWAQATMTALQVAGWLGFAASLAAYDLGRLAGTAQLREARAGTEAPADDEPFHVVGPHRWVRHPLYAAGFLILWGRVDTEFDLATAVWASAYLVIGSRFEERDLARRAGPAYERYRRRVPAFVPWKGRLSDDRT